MSTSDTYFDSIWLNPRSLAVFQYAVSEFCIHLSRDDQSSIFNWTDAARRLVAEPFPYVDFSHGFLRERQIQNYVRALKYYVACGLTPVIQYSTDCLRKGGNLLENVWGPAYVLDSGTYDRAYRFRVGYPVRNIVVAFPLHEKLYNLVLWGEDRAEKQPKCFEWITLEEAKTYAWLSKLLPNKEPSEVHYEADWRDIHFLKYTIRDFERITSSVMLDNFVMNSQKMLNTFCVLSGKVVSVSADPRHGVYRTVLADATATIRLNVGFSGCRFPKELKRGDHLVCLCTAQILSRTPFAIESYLVEEQQAYENAGLGYIKFRRISSITEFENLFGFETLETLEKTEIVKRLKNEISYVPRAYSVRDGYTKPDPKVGVLRLQTVHRFDADLYSKRSSVEMMYVPVRNQLSPLPRYLRTAGDLFYYYGFPRHFWKEIFEFSEKTKLPSPTSLPCPSCPVRLKSSLISSTESHVERNNPVCIVYAISKRLINESLSKDFDFKEFETFLKSKDSSLIIDYDQGDMVVRDFLWIVRISSLGEIIASDGKLTELKYESIIEGFLRGVRCPYVSMVHQN